MRAPAAVAATALIACLAQPRPAAWVLALAVVVVCGVPHGALDAEVARTFLRPRAGRWWFLVFAVPYLALAGGVLMAWRLAPEATLAGFLLLSVLHFGVEDAGPGRPLEAIARGGLPIAVPVLAQGAETARFLSAVAAAPVGVPGWLEGGATLWAPVTIVALLGVLREGRSGAAAEMAVLAAAFAVTPPPVAFAGYFVLLHAPRHMAGLVADTRRAPRVRHLREAWRRALPVTLLTIAIGALLWPLYAGPPAERLAALVVQGLAALTLPHMLLGAATEQSAADNGFRRHHLLHGEAAKTQGTAGDDADDVVLADAADNASGAILDAHGAEAARGEDARGIRGGRFGHDGDGRRRDGLRVHAHEGRPPD